jgi:hypothetical protein
MYGPYSLPTSPPKLLHGRSIFNTLPWTQLLQLSWVIFQYLANTSPNLDHHHDKP